MVVRSSEAILGGGENQGMLGLIAAQVACDVCTAQVRPLRVQCPFEGSNPSFGIGVWRLLGDTSSGCLLAQGGPQRRAQPPGGVFVRDAGRAHDRRVRGV